MTGHSCHQGSCFKTCTGSAACPIGEACYDGRCASSICDGVQCSSAQNCFEGVCFNSCTTASDCAGSLECVDGRCAEVFCYPWQECDYLDTCDTSGTRERLCEEAICDSVSCITYEHIQIEACSRDVGCPPAGCSPACPGNQLCWGEQCFPSGCLNNNQCGTNQRCLGLQGNEDYNRCVGQVDPCALLTCPDQCYQGGCFKACTLNSECPSDSLCYEGRCAQDPCAYVLCETEDICVGGTCFDPCTGPVDCATGLECFAGHCAVDACDGIQCPQGQQCEEGTCFNPCTTELDCDLGQACFNGRCATGACEGVVCSTSQACYEGSCFDSCTTTIDCAPDHACYSGRCATDACDGVLCSTAQNCYEGSCFDSCTTTVDCAPDHACYSGRCATDVCEGVQCLTTEACYEGSCFDTCTESIDCAPDHACYSGRCTTDVCDGVQCLNTQACYAGSCFETCNESVDCKPDHACYSGLCMTGPCDGVQCLNSEVCYEGSCFDSCATTVDCAPNHVCYSGRCTTGPCEGVNCLNSQVCHEGSCFDTCTTTIDCAPDHACYSGRCATSECDGIQCPDTEVCFAGSCFDSCTEDVDCQPNHACYSGHCATDACVGVFCQATEVCYGGTCFDSCLTEVDCLPNHACFSGRCALDACEGVECSASESCYLGSCFTACNDNDQCLPTEGCYNYRCAANPCAGVSCPAKHVCSEGSCFLQCDDEDACDETSHCYLGLCTQDECDFPNPVVCHPGQKCHQGSCFDTCGSSLDCTEPFACFEGRCAANSCAAKRDEYNDNHVYRKVGAYWPTIHQRSMPWYRPRPFVFTGTYETAVAAGIAAGIPARGKAGVVLYVNPTTKQYGIVLVHGRETPSQGEGGATYSVRYEDLKTAPAVRMSAGTYTLVTLDDDFLHQQIQIHNSATKVSAVALGYLPADEDWRLTIDASFRGDLTSWEFYSADTKTWIALDAGESLQLRNVAMTPDIYLAEEVGVLSCDPGLPQSKGICKSGMITNCKNGQLICDSIVIKMDYELCDGRDNNCNGEIDEIEHLKVPMAFVRQENTVPDWRVWPSVDRQASAADYLNFTPHEDSPREGSTDVLALGSGEQLQERDRSLIFFHRNLQSGVLSMPMVHGALETTSLLSSVSLTTSIEAQFEFKAGGSDTHSRSDLMFTAFFEDWFPAGNANRDQSPSTLKFDEAKHRWQLRRWGSLLTPTRESDASVMQFMWAASADNKDLRFDLKLSLPSSVNRWRLHAPYAALRTLDSGKTFEVKIMKVPIEETTCFAEEAFDGCRATVYSCQAGKITCLTPTAETCTGCRDLDGDGYFGYDELTCPDGDDCDDDDLNINPGVVEVCDGVDRNCDGVKDGLTPGVQGCPDGSEICGPAECAFRNACLCPSGNADCFCDSGLMDVSMDNGGWTAGEPATLISSSPELGVDAHFDHVIATPDKAESAASCAVSSSNNAPKAWPLAGLALLALWVRRSQRRLANLTGN
ncbi:MAG: hypothetical protein H0U74_22810 [Bradymonadaceae bacterium]|nr:hypothetical protein [Lujinxingiaceae bacterium]